MSSGGEGGGEVGLKKIEKLIRNAYLFFDFPSSLGT